MKRQYKTLSDDQRVEHERKVAAIEAERPETDVWAHASLDRLETIDRVIAALRSARMAKGLSLGEIDERCGLGRSNISRIENHPQPNPTLETLMVFADAVGVDLRIAVVDRENGRIMETQEAA